MKKIIISLLLVLCSHISSLCQNTSTTIYTPRGTSVQATITSEMPLSYSPEEEMYMWHYYDSLYQAQVIGYPDPRYNGNGYAWHVSEGGNYVITKVSQVMAHLHNLT